MGRQLGTGPHATRRNARVRSRRIPAAAAALVVALAAPAGVAGQQDTTGVRPDTLAADTLAADSLGRDSLAARDTLTPRERAILRLRGLRRSPVQPDTAAADSLAADTAGVEAAGVEAAGVEAAGVDTTGVDTTGVAADSVATDTARLAPQPPDTARLRPPPGEERPALAVDSAGGGRRPSSRGDDPAVLRETEVLEALRGLAGYTRTEYRGDGAVFRADTDRLELTGDSRISREGSTLETDSVLIYDGGSGVVCGYGAPVLSGENDDPVTSDRVCFDVERDVGMAEGARTRFTRGATWYVQGANNRVYVLSGAETSTLYGQRAEFTSCDLEHPHYTFKARSMRMQEGGMMVARDVTLRFEDVPVFWLPWMISPMQRGRRSGILMPQFGVNDIVRNSAGYSRHLTNVGFYWAINDYASARSTFEWFANNWTAVEGAMTYRVRRQFLGGNLTAKHYWRQREGEPGRREFTLNTNNNWQPDERTRLQLSGNYASSTDFVRDNSYDPTELNQSIRSSASANRSFDWGSVTLGADRTQQLADQQVDMKLPSLSVNLSPVTLYQSDGGFGVTWNGSGSATRRTRDVLEDSIRGARDTEQLNTSLRHSLSLGRFSVSQSVSYDRLDEGPKPAFGIPIPVPGGPDAPLLETVGPDTPPFGHETGESLDWSTSTGFQQGLWVGTTLNPRISVSGRQVRNAQTRAITDSLGVARPGDYVAAPARVSAGASLSTAIYGFWPGMASFSRIRHKIAPSLNWSYAPEPEISELQDAVFGTSLREQNRLTLSFSQTFEAKLAASDTVAADTAELGQPGEPRRLPQAQKITLLALNTGTPFVYDFVAAREDGRGFLTDQISNSIRSDLVQGLQLSMTHDLFEEGFQPEEGPAPRTLDPFLTRLSASFTVNSDFWLLRLLGLTSPPDAASGQQEAAQDTADAEGPGEGLVGAEGRDDDPAGVGSMVPGQRGRSGPSGGVAGGGSGRWQVSLNYSLQRARPRPGATSAGDNQLLQANISFNPTEHWSVRWNTAYSFTDQEFANHYLTLTRDLHRWQANFDFIKAQNGNFALQFRVRLLDQTDLKLDYDQRQRGGDALPRGPGPVGAN